jgi:hypothetical protein
MARTRETGVADKRPDLATGCGNEFRPLVRWHAAADHSRGGPFHIREFELAVKSIVNCEK